MSIPKICFMTPPKANGCINRAGTIIASADIDPKVEISPNQWCRDRISAAIHPMPAAVAGRHSHPSTRNARSICAVAASMSVIFLVSAALKSSPTAYFQCGRALRQAVKAPTNFAASSSVAKFCARPTRRLDHPRQRGRRNQRRSPPCHRWSRSRSA